MDTLENLLEEDDDLPENTELAYVWELDDGFVRAFKTRFRAEARTCEHLAREENHQFCYLVPTLGLGGSIKSVESIRDTLHFIAMEEDKHLEMVASPDFKDKWGPALMASKHLAEIVGETIQ